MEEKERYEVHIYDDVRVDLYNNGVLDKSINDTYKLEKLLNQQDKENQQLKQQLHDLPNKIVEEIRDCVSKRIMEKQIKWGDNTQIGFICNAINDCLDIILEEFGDKNEN